MFGQGTGLRSDVDKIGDAGMKGPILSDAEESIGLSA